MERTTRAAGHGQDGWLVTGSLRRWDCSGGNVDVITDFSTGQSDKLNLADVLDFDPLTQQCDIPSRNDFPAPCGRPTSPPSGQLLAWLSTATRERASLRQHLMPRTTTVLHCAIAGLVNSTSLALPFRTHLWHPGVAQKEKRLLGVP